MQDRLKDQGEKLIEFNSRKEEKEAQLLFISVILSVDLKQTLLVFFEGSKGVFG